MGKKSLTQTHIENIDLRMETKKEQYYAITTSMTFEKTVLVPVDSVEDIDEAIDLVDMEVEVASIDLLNEEAIFETRPSPYANVNGIYELTDKDAECYEIVKGEKEE